MTAIGEPSEKYGKKLSDVLDEMTFPLPEELRHVAPNRICDGCLEQLDQFTAYKKRLNCVLKFIFGLTQVKKGNKSTLEELFTQQHDYVLGLLKELGIFEGSKLRLEDLLAEFSQYEISAMPDVKHESRDEESKDFMEDSLVKVELDETGMIVEYIETSIKRKRGRPKAVKKEDTAKKRPGRPRKSVVVDDESAEDDKPLKTLKVPITSDAGEEDDDDAGELYDNDFIEERLSNASEHYADQDLSEMLENTDGQLQDEDSEGDFQLDESLVAQSKPKKYGKRSSIKGHRKGELQYCDRCKFKTYYPRTFEVHMEKHLLKEQYPSLQRCKRCDMEFENKKELDKHKRLEHRDYMCDTCGLSFEQKFALETHRKRHDSVRQFKCDYCPMEYYTRPEMLLHIKQVHLNAFEVKCPECGLSFKTKSTLNQHIKTHTNQRTHTCSVCGYGFKSYTHLNRHIKSVHQDVRFKCDHCEISYGRKDKLRMHMEKVHNIQTYFVCDVCLQSYNSKEKLDDHKVHHDNPKPLQCGICLAAHMTQDEFDQHLCITYKDNYVCCNRDFKFHFYYNKHMFLAHGLKTNVRVKPAQGLLLGQLRAMRKQAERCPRCEQEFGTRNQKKQHMLSCRGPGTADGPAIPTIIAAEAVLGPSSAGAVSSPMDAPSTSVPNTNASPVYEIEYIDNYDADEVVHKVEVV